MEKPPPTMPPATVPDLASSSKKARVRSRFLHHRPRCGAVRFHWDRIRGSGRGESLVPSLSGVIRRLFDRGHRQESLGGRRKPFAESAQDAASLQKREPRSPRSNVGHSSLLRNSIKWSCVLRGIVITFLVSITRGALGSRAPERLAEKPTLCYEVLNLGLA